MIRIVLSFLIITSSLFSSISASSGIFQTYAIVNADGAGDTYLAGGINSDGAVTVFDNYNFGTPATLILNGGEVKTFKNGSDDIFGARIFYRVYKQTDTPGAFIELNLPFAENIGTGGDQKWAETSAGVDVLAAATAGNGDYFLEAYWTSPFNFGTHIDNNSGNNYKASFTISVMPVELSSFKADTDKNTVDLNWQTAQEINNDYFQIERKTANSHAWEIIGKKQGEGNSETAVRYNFTDTKPVSGVNYYRLKQTDFDGQFEYSEMVSAEIRHTILIDIFPNPTASELTVITPVDFTKGEIRLFDAMGKMVISKTANERNYLNLSNLNSGIYFFRLLDENGNVVAEDKIRKL